MDYYFVAKGKGKEFIGQISLEEIMKRFHSGLLPGEYVATKSFNQSYSQLIKSGTAMWINVADLVANMSTQTSPTSIAQVEPLSTEEALRKHKAWFIGVEESGDSKHYYDKEQIATELRANILEGKHVKTNSVVIHSKDKNGNWQQSASTLEQFAKNHFKIRVLYQPVWSHALAGLKWGALIGIGLKFLDTLIMLGLVNPVLAIMFLVIAGVCAIPRIGIVAMIVVSIVISKFTSANLFITLLSVMLIGSMLGCLPGMAIGGIVGIGRKTSLPLARDAEPEGDADAFKAVVLPLLGGACLWGFYLFVFNPWLINVIGK